MSTKRKLVIVTKESHTGRNLQFQNKSTGRKMSRAEFIGAIEGGKYQGYHIRNIKGIKTPASN